MELAHSAFNGYRHSLYRSGPSLLAQRWRTHQQCRGCGFDPWVRKILWRRAWQPTPVFLPGKSHEQRSLAGYMGLQRIEHDRNDLTPTHCSLPGASVSGILCHYKKKRQKVSFSVRRQQEGSHVQTRNGVLNRYHQTRQHLDLGLPSLPLHKTKIAALGDPLRI